MKTPSIYAVAALAAALVMSLAPAALALTPNTIWSVPNGSFGRFSADGSSVLVRLGSAFQLRRASDGSLERSITLPAESLTYRAAALSNDKQLLGLAIHASAVTRVELWSFTTGKLVRTITIGQIREVKSLDFTADGLIATYERFGYGDGGIVRIYRASDGSLVNQQGPYTRNSSTNLRFSPDGRYLAIQDLWSSSGVRVVRTSDWSTALQIGNSAFLGDWSRDSASLWVSVGTTRQLIAIPAGTVTRSATYDSTKYYVSTITPDARLLLGESNTNDNQIVFLRATDGSVLVTYTLSTNQAGAGEISPLGNLFMYFTCQDGAACTLGAARVPTP